MMSKAFIALGTNIEPRLDHLEQAIHHLDESSNIAVIQKSSIYETAPVGYTDQADFLNMVIEVQTTLMPFDLLTYCQKVEQNLGRKRTIRFGPRSIDLDILLFDNKVIDEATLIVPHPRMHERAFVLVPLNELNSRVELKGQTIEHWLKQLPDEDIEDVRLLRRI
ncbi:2-amino-4-hydroxy-6-hydroxymethyldihydropteridine diphosphokinase [Aquisalibacillus elongatus]|uniref:2-amino-4-hydroxy-6-hydroxymethyldihydropteridine diphosphokinase n=1 Tax=Aquisalibacillus elongatus TaxID=485577 RepID=A0A3N5BZD9_9BACI|nr:2-amino-4-hydroxy-6-hydroxymethyldihydropteridine diphosphokinase [Aquisalibacillus elongatus]